MLSLYSGLTVVVQKHVHFTISHHFFLITHGKKYYLRISKKIYSNPHLKIKYFLSKNN